MMMTFLVASIDGTNKMIGWVIVDFSPNSNLVFHDGCWWMKPEEVDSNFCPYDLDSKGYANEKCLTFTIDWDIPNLEVHPWPLPLEVLNRLKRANPDRDWSTVPVAEE